MEGAKHKEKAALDQRFIKEVSRLGTIERDRRTDEMLYDLSKVLESADPKVAALINKNEETMLTVFKSLADDFSKASGLMVKDGYMVHVVAGKRTFPELVTYLIDAYSRMENDMSFMYSYEFEGNGSCTDAQKLEARMLLAGAVNEMTPDAAHKYLQDMMYSYHDAYKGVIPHIPRGMADIPALFRTYNYDFGKLHDVMANPSAEDLRMFAESKIQEITSNIKNQESTLGEFEDVVAKVETSTWARQDAAVNDIMLYVSDLNRASKELLIYLAAERRRHGVDKSAYGKVYNGQYYVLIPYENVNENTRETFNKLSDMGLARYKLAGKGYPYNIGLTKEGLEVAHEIATRYVADYGMGKDEKARSISWSVRD